LEIMVRIELIPLPRDEGPINGL
jgi:hypothetical protein